MTYQYQRPKGRLYKVPIRKWNKEFAYQGQPPLVTTYIYLNNKQATVEFKINLIGKTVLVLLSPAFYAYGTIKSGFPEIHRYMVRTFWQEKYGTFDSKVIKENDPKVAWGRMLRLIKENL